jgi:hypothetical protein
MTRTLEALEWCTCKNGASRQLKTLLLFREDRSIVVYLYCSMFSILEDALKRQVTSPYWDSTGHCGQPIFAAWRLWQGRLGENKKRKVCLHSSDCIVHYERG